MLNFQIVSHPRLSVSFQQPHNLTNVTNKGTPAIIYTLTIHNTNYENVSTVFDSSCIFNLAYLYAVTDQYTLYVSIT